MIDQLIQLVYLVATALFIFSLKWMSDPLTARRGVFAGVGGAFLSVTAAGLFEDFITGGRGFIAIVLAMLARGKAMWVLIGSFIFGISLSLSDALQIAGVDISTDVVFTLPFVAVIVVLVIFGRRSYLPPALGLPYVRGAR